MRHRRSNRKIGLKSSHRIAVLKNMFSSLILSGAITTTTASARELRSFAERLLTLAKHATVTGNIEKHRVLRSIISTDIAYNKLLFDIVPKISNRNGGYLRITKLMYRAGDSADISKIEFVD